MQGFTLWLVLSLSALTGAFVPSRSTSAHIRLGPSMKWQFSKGTGSMQDLGGIGAQGEYYYIPSKRPNLKAPAAALGKERVVPIFPRNQVLGPLGEEYLGVYEMRYRQLLNDIGEGGTFGHLYYSQENSKLALVGTLARVKRTERLDDGGIYVVMEGIGRFYIKEVVSEKPYLRSKIQLFNDYSESESMLAALEKQVLDEVRYSVKVMKLLYPQNNYTMNELVLKYRPPTPESGVRPVSLEDEQMEIDRRSKFSFAVIGMLKTDPTTKLLFLQEPILERRYSKILKVLQDSIAYLEGELKKRGIVSEDSMQSIRESSLLDTSDLEGAAPSAWVLNNFVDGEWVMSPILD